jgi:murein DD-endopeptidase MepM/ murein hydrolase activator NlpD
MAAPTTTRPDGDTDKNNPSAELARREFDDVVKNNINKQTADPTQENQNIDKLRNAENGAQAPDKTALNDSAAGKAAVTAASGAASAVATPLGGALVKMIGKIKTKKGGIGSMIALFIVSVFVLVATFLGPGLLIVQVKETLNDKYNDLFASLDARAHIVIKKKLNITGGICKKNVKVLCRFNGFSDKQLKALEHAGMKVNTDGKTISGKTKVTSIEMPDGTKVTAANLDSVMKNNLDARRSLARAFNPRYVAYASQVFENLRLKLRISKQKNVSGATDKDMDARMKNTIEGKDAAGREIGKVTTTVDEKGVVRDQNGNIVSEADLKQLNEFNDAIDKTAQQLADVGKTATFSLAKAGFFALSGIGAVDGLCTAYNYLQLVGYGAKVIAAQQLIRFAFVFLNTGDLIKAGDATQEIVGYVGKKMTALNQFGQSFTDAFYYKFAAFGSLAFPKGKTDGETADLRNAISQFTVGDGIVGVISDLAFYIDKAVGGKADEICKAVKSIWGQLGLAALSIGATVFTGGANLGVGAFVFGGVQAAMSIAMAMALPKIMSMVAGTLVTTNTKGGDAGNAAVSGMAQLNAQNAGAHGLSPLTKDRVLNYTNKTKRVAAEYDAAERKVANPFDITNPVTPAYAVATAINTEFNSPASFLRSPFKIFQNAASSLFAPAVNAADPLAEYKICDDKLYNDKNYAADPTCSIRYGLGDEELGFDPETVTLEMYDQGMVDDDGNPKEGTEYAAYVDECMNRATPLGSTGEDNQEGDGSVCSDQADKYRKFRIFYLDNSVTSSMDEEVSTPVAATDTTVIAPGATKDGWVWPMSGIGRADVDNGWGDLLPKGVHKALDIGAKVGTPVLAAHDGVVSSRSFDSATCGRMYLIKATGTNVWMTYQHLAIAGNPLPDGTAVKAGQQIGAVGIAGGFLCGSRGYYHLHFGVELTEHISTYADPISLSTDPLKYLP